MRQFLIDSLKLLEGKVPPPARCHHALTYAQYGNDADGWSDRLAIQINRGGVFNCLFIEEGDMDGTPESLVAAIVAALPVRMER